MNLTTYDLLAHIDDHGDQLIEYVYQNLPTYSAPVINKILDIIWDSSSDGRAKIESFDPYTVDIDTAVKVVIKALEDGKLKSTQMRSIMSRNQFRLEVAEVLGDQCGEY